MPEVPSSNPFQFLEDLDNGEPIQPTFSHISLKRQLLDGKISIIDYKFLRNVLGIFAYNRDVLRDVIEFRNLLNQGQQPGESEFVKMQNLGCKNYPLTGLDLSGYSLPDVKLGCGEIGGHLQMRFTNVEGDVEMGLLKVRQSVDMTGMRIKGDVMQHGMRTGGGVTMQEAEVEGNVQQTGIRSQFSLDMRGLKARNVYQIFAGAEGRADFRGAKLQKLDQIDANIKDGTDLTGAQVKTLYQGSADDL